MTQFIGVLPKMCPECTDFLSGLTTIANVPSRGNPPGSGVVGRDECHSAIPSMFSIGVATLQLPRAAARRQKRGGRGEKETMY